LLTNLNSAAVLVLQVATIALGVTSVGYGQLDFEKPPIDYGKAETHDRVAQLAAKLNAGEVQLHFDKTHGWLPDVLKHLDISTDSQVLVFSKTSLQLHKISPHTPRALYFNDDVYVGWCQNGDVVELAATDPEQGAVFYTIDQDPASPPKVVRDQGQCLTCHASVRTQSVPGYLIRSVYPDYAGRPRTGTRTYTTDHRSPFEQRWGGWYVTGTHGSMRHLGNALASDRRDPELLDLEAGANLKQLDRLFDTENYLTPHSDLVALLVLEHQSQMHNLIARASFEARIATHYDRGINEALGRPIDTVSESTGRRIASAGEALVRYMLFADESPMSNAVEGTSPFASSFENSCTVVKDEHGRNLRQLDLKSRLLKYPCSWLIYTQAFDRLPPPAMEYIQGRLTEILFSKDSPKGFESLSNADRQAIAEILRETKPGLLK
jgi:hypothetical protein